MATKKTNSKKETALPLSELTPAELLVRVSEIKQQLLKNKMDLAVHKIRNLRVNFHLRKELARAKSMIK